jgi:predicted lipoprotein with Yx(FWY)xxD motif
MSVSNLAARLLAVTATLLLASACGDSSVTIDAAPGAAKAGAPGGVLGVATSSLGPVLVDGDGQTVYLLTADTPGHSSCNAQCLQFWPIVAAPAGTPTPTAKGVSAPLSVAKATDGSSMLTAGGWPLYKFAQDKTRGDVNGQGKKSFGGTWYAVSPSGQAVTTPAASPTTGAGVKGGYGY